MQGDPRSRARDRVLGSLKHHGPETAARIAGRLRITPMGVRQHLAALEREGLVAYQDERRPVGRPARVWHLTAKAAERFPDAHAELTVELLAAMRTAFGSRGVDRLIRARTREQERRYRARIPGPGSPLSRRVAALAAIRREEGYMAESRRESGGAFLLVENHCPVCAAARVCQGLCRQELTLFRSVLGKDVRVEREEHVLEGARRCAYRIRPVPVREGRRPTRAPRRG